MGRHAGFLTAAAVMGRQNPDDGPHLVYVPEVAFDETKFLADVDAVYKKHGRCLIAVSEGIEDANKQPIAIKLALAQGVQVQKDDHGNYVLSGTGALGDFLAEHIKTKLKIKRVRADTLGYPQRSFPGIASPVDAAEARQVGRRAAQLAAAGDLSASVTLQRVGSHPYPYRVDYGRAELADIAAKTRHLPADWIVDGNNIADAFRNYAAPLLGDLPGVESLW
jgi:6-phosphofructokinase 1